MTAREHIEAAEASARAFPAAAQVHAILALTQAVRDVGASVDDVAEVLKHLQTDVGGELSRLNDNAQDAIAALRERNP